MVGEALLPGTHLEAINVLFEIMLSADADRPFVLLHFRLKQLSYRQEQRQRYNYRDAGIFKLAAYFLYQRNGME